MLIRYWAYSALEVTHGAATLNLVTLIDYQHVIYLTDWTIILVKRQVRLATGRMVLQRLTKP
jgi:hypothetical protein